MCYRKFSFALSLVAAGSIATAQFTEPVLMDAGPTVEGVNAIVCADLNGDGYLDVVTAIGTEQGALQYYRNNSGSLLDGGPIPVDAELPFLMDVTAVDLDLNGQLDLAVVTREEGELMWYPNVDGAFDQRLVLDSGLVQLVGIEAADVNGGFNDLVVIGQQRIAWYRNGGDGVFTEQVILTPGTSTLPLELTDLKVADIDGDTDMDLVTAEVIGPVVYLNNGDGVFTAELVDGVQAPQERVVLADLDLNGSLDISVVNGSGNARTYLQLEQGWSPATGILAGAPVITLALDQFDATGPLEAITAQGSQLLLHAATGPLAFDGGSPVTDVAPSSVSVLSTGDLDNDSRLDLVWASPSGRLSYQLNELITSTQEAMASATGHHATVTVEGIWVQWGVDAQAVDWQLYDALGRRSAQGRSPGDRFVIPRPFMADGVHMLVLTKGDDRAVIRLFLER
jgi:hypothetical protein